MTKFLFDDLINRNLGSLRKLCTPCGTEDVSGIINDLIEAAKILNKQSSKNKLFCSGLSANQIFHYKRVFIILIGRKYKPFIDPVIVEGMGRKMSREQCYSLPLRVTNVERFISLKVKARNIKKVLRLETRSAIAFQHCMDHLDGKIV
jgi:peptide deformylase